MFKQSSYVKLRVAAPRDSAERIREVLGEAGAGVQGSYDFCSFTYPVSGHFRPLKGARPALGRVGELETVAEEIIEVLCHKDKVKEAIKALRLAHPYEEPAIDIIPRLELE